MGERVKIYDCKKTLFMEALQVVLNCKRVTGDMEQASNLRMFSNESDISFVERKTRGTYEPTIRMQALIS
jgi:hypothetical protein